MAVTLGPALCYPSGWDELVYHHELPRRWFQAGALDVFRDLPYSGFPASGEILFWVLTPWDAPIAPRLLIWLCWAFGLWGIYRLVVRHAGRGPALAVACASALNDSVLLISANCYVESLQMLNGVALLLMVQVAGRQRWSRWTVATGLGILSGGAAAVKLTGAAWLAAPFVWYGSQLLTHRMHWRRAVGESALAVAVALAVCSPFYLRPWLATANPFYPYWANWFTQDTAQLEVSRHHHLIGGIGFGVPDSWSFLTAPILLAFRADNYDGEFGWQFLVLLILAMVAVSSWGRRRMRARLLWPLGLSLWLYLFWFLTSQQARFAIPALAAVLLVGSLGLRLLSRRARAMVSGILMVTSLLSVPWHRAGYYAASWLTVAGVMSRTDYVHNLTDLAYLPLVQALQAKTPPQARVMLLFEHRGYYLPRDHQVGTPLFQEGPFTPPERYGTSTAVLAAIQAHAISHVVLAKGPVGPDQAPGWYERQAPLLRGIEQAVGQGSLRIVWESEFYVVLEVAGTA
ncbi:MAG: hypothetical protein AB7O38_25470 [Pirellulaceae bacterium]